MGFWNDDVAFKVQDGNISCPSLVTIIQGTFVVDSHVFSPRTATGATGTSGPISFPRLRGALERDADKFRFSAA